MRIIRYRQVLHECCVHPHTIPIKTTAYLRVSTGGQDLDQQKLAILDDARRHRMPVADFVEVHGSAGSPAQREQLLGLNDLLQPVTG